VALTETTGGSSLMEQSPNASFASQQEKWLPHFSCLFFVTGCVTAGWGNRDLMFVAASGFVLVSSLWLLHVRKWVTLCCFTAAGCVGSYWTECFLLYPYWGLLLAILGSAPESHGSVLLLAATAFLLSVCNYFDAACWWFQPAFLFAVTAAVFTLGLVRSHRSDGGLVRRTTAAAALLSACVSLVGAMAPSCGIKSVAFDAGPSGKLHFGGTASRIAGDHAALLEVIVPDFGHLVGGASHTPSKPDTPEVVLLEHDSRSTLYGGRNLHQSLPWGAHTFFGNQYLASAIERDGVLATNLGGSLSRDAGKPILMGNAFRHSSRVEALVAREGRRVVISDSDVLADKLAAYNPAFIRELTGNSQSMRVIALVFSIAAIAFVLNLREPMLIVATLTVVAGAAYAHLPQVGDVRLCCETGNPHDDSAAFAILRAINESGSCAIRGEKQCRILCVGSGVSARWAGEKVVILEPRAACRIGALLVSCDNVPLGNLPEVPNAMQLRVGDISYRGKAEIEGIVFLGTGSPAKQDAQRWLSIAQ